MADRERYLRRCRTQWRGLLSEWKNSGLSQQRFCERHGLTLSTFQRWRKRLREDVDAAVDSGLPSSVPRLLPVRLLDEAAASSSGVAIRVGDRLRVEVDREFDADTLRRVVGALGSAL